MVKKPHSLDWMTIGQISKRTGIAASAIRFYEDQGLIDPTRDRAGQRRFRRMDIRLLSFVMATQNLGFPLSRIKQELDRIPKDKPLGAKEWAKISATFGQELDKRIESLTQLRANLEGCIGCGCLSMENCKLFNPEDKASTLGQGPRYVMGNSASEVT